MGGGRSMVWRVSIPCDHIVNPGYTYRPVGDQGNIIFRIHAIRRMFERALSVDDVRAVLATGETIDEYRNDVPYPSRLVFGTVGNRPVHVVAADDVEHGETIVITAYEPDPARWEPDFKRRKP